MRTEMRALLIGAGGHGKVVLDAWQLASPGLQPEVRDDRSEVSVLLGCPVAHPAVPDMTAATDVHIAVGDNRSRQDIAARLMLLGPRLAAVIHPAAQLSGHAVMGPGVFVAARAIVGPGATVGAGTIVNHGAIVDHDCCVGDWVHIAPGAILGGGVSLGHRVLVGAGAVILPGMRIADDAVIGAGAVVTKNVGERQCWIGVPARHSYG